MLNSDFIGQEVTLTYPSGQTFTGVVTYFRTERKLYVVRENGGRVDFGYYNSADGGQTLGNRYTVETS